MPRPAPPPTATPAPAEIGSPPGSGFTLLEVAIGVVLLALAFVGLGGLLIVNERSQEVALEESLATGFLRGLADRIRSAPFGEVVATYADTVHPVTELGGTCTVKIFVDETANDADAATLGLPRDLDGDGAATSTNVSASYMLVPIRLELAWTGREGAQLRTLSFLLAQDR